MNYSEPLCLVFSRVFCYIGTKGSVIESSCEAYAEPMTKGAVESTGSDYCGQKVERAFAGGTLAS